MRSFGGFSAPRSFSSATPRSFSAPRSFSSATPGSLGSSVGTRGSFAGHVRTTQSFGNLGAMARNGQFARNGGGLAGFGGRRGEFGGRGEFGRGERGEFRRGERGEFRRGAFFGFDDFYPFGFSPFFYPDIYPDYLSYYNTPGYDDMPYYYGDYSPGIYGYGGGYDMPDGGGALVSADGGYEPTVVASTTSGTPTGEQYYTDAIAAFQRGDYQGASRLDGHAMIDLPRDARTHELMSLAMFALGNYRGAAMEAHAALILGPVADWPTLYSYYNDLPTYTKQLDALKKYVADKPSEMDGRFVMAYHDLMMGHKAQAEEILTQVATKVPQDKVVADLLKQLQGGTDTAAAHVAAGQHTSTGTAAPPASGERR